MAEQPDHQDGHADFDDGKRAILTTNLPTNPKKLRNVVFLSVFQENFGSEPPISPKYSKSVPLLENKPKSDLALLSGAGRGGPNFEVSEPPQTSAQGLYKFAVVLVPGYMSGHQRSINHWEGTNATLPCFKEASKYSPIKPTQLTLSAHHLSAKVRKDHYTFQDASE